jgi:hypothetical protein
MEAASIEEVTASEIALMYAVCAINGQNVQVRHYWIGGLARINELLGFQGLVRHH